MDERAAELLAFFFAGAERDPEGAAARRPVWFAPDPAFDAALEARFGALAEAAARGELDAWQGSPRERLALVLLLDQLPRNLHRGSARAFASDARALALCREGVAEGHDRALSPVERGFLYMPLQHDEALEGQRESVARFEALHAEAAPAWHELTAGFVDYARDHLAVIERFGRFPHRNAALGREASEAERRYLAEGGEDYGQGGTGADGDTNGPG